MLYAVYIGIYARFLIILIVAWDLTLYWRCSFRLVGQCESLNSWNEWQDWIHAWTRNIFFLYWLSIYYRWPLGSLIPQCSQIITPFATDSQEVRMRLFVTEWWFAVVNISSNYSGRYAVLILWRNNSSLTFNYHFAFDAHKSYWISRK